MQDGTTSLLSSGRNTLDDTSPRAGEVFRLLRASRRARNARRSKLCSAPTAKTGAPALEPVPSVVSQGNSPLLPSTGAAARRLLAPPPGGGAVKRRVTLRRLTERGHSLDSSPVKASRPRAAPCLPSAVLGTAFSFSETFSPAQTLFCQRNGSGKPGRARVYSLRAKSLMLY